ncbi:piggyBac transposable element-derived protein 4-like, partial [Vespula squamosa]
KIIFVHCSCLNTQWKLKVWSYNFVVADKRTSPDINDNTLYILRSDVLVNIKKLNIIVNYIKYMNGIDGADQYVSTYCFLRKSLTLNGRKRKEKPLTHLRYLKTFVQQLRETYHQPRDRVSTSSINEPRLNGKLHVILRRVKRDYKVCSDRSKSGCRHETSKYRDTYPNKPRMHLGDCFVKYHTRNNYRV